MVNAIIHRCRSSYWIALQSGEVISAIVTDTEVNSCFELVNANPTDSRQFQIVNLGHEILDNSGALPDI